MLIKKPMMDKDIDDLAHMTAGLDDIGKSNMSSQTIFYSLVSANNGVMFLKMVNQIIMNNGINPRMGFHESKPRIYMDKPPGRMRIK